MKWGGFTRNGEAKLRRVFGGKGLYVLMTIAMLGLLLVESFKWHPY